MKKSYAAMTKAELIKHIRREKRKAGQEIAYWYKAFQRSTEQGQQWKAMAEKFGPLMTVMEE